MKPSLAMTFPHSSNSQLPRNSAAVSVHTVLPLKTSSATWAWPSPKAHIAPRILALDLQDPRQRSALICIHLLESLCVYRQVKGFSNLAWTLPTRLALYEEQGRALGCGHTEPRTALEEEEEDPGEDLPCEMTTASLTGPCC